MNIDWSRYGHLRPSARQVADAIYAAGPSGLHSFRLREPEYGSHIDAPKRVSEAVAAGCPIVSDPCKLNGRLGRLYTWTPDAERGAVAESPTHDGSSLSAGVGAPGARTLSPPASRSGPFLRPMPEVSLARLDAACKAAREVTEETGVATTLEDAVLIACGDDQQEMAA